MPRNRQHLGALLRRSRAVVDPTRRFVDLAVEFEVVDGPRPGLVLEPYGGRWDKLLQGYVGHWEPGSGWYGDRPEHVHRIKIAHQCVNYIEDWTHAMILAEGGRRSGKTMGALAPKIVVCLLVFAGLPGEVLSPTYKQSKNVRSALLRHIPRHWWEKWPQPSTPPITMTLVNGSTVTMLSADNEDSARSAGVAWGAYDERQDIVEESAANAFLSTSEGDAPFIFETATIKAELKAHHDTLIESAHGSVYRMDSYGNPFIKHTLFDLASEFLDQRTIDREIHALWPELVGRIYYPFDAEDHVRTWSGRGDSTEAILNSTFDTAPAGTSGAARWLVSIDPPGYAAIWKLLSDETMWMVHEVLVGSDGRGGDVRELAERCKSLCDGGRGVAVKDPHDNKYDRDVSKYFRQAGFKMASLRRIIPEYRFTSVRARLERHKLVIDPRCPHAIEVMERHQYKSDGSGDADKIMTYEKAHHKWSKRVQLVHLADAIGYGVYKLFPAKYDYESNEENRAA